MYIVFRLSLSERSPGAFLVFLVFLIFLLRNRLQKEKTTIHLWADQAQAFQFLEDRVKILVITYNRRLILLADT